MKFSFIRISLLGLLFVFSFHWGNAKEYILEYNLSKGDSFKQNMITNVLTKQTIQGQEINISMKMDMDIRFDVTNVLNNTYTIQMKFDAISMDMDMGFTSMSFTSNTEKTIATENDLNPMLKAMTNQPFTMVMDRYGKVQSVNGYTDFIDAMLNSIDKDIDEETKEQMIAQFQAQFSDEAMKSMFEQMSAYYPGKPVKKKDSWTSDMSVSSGQFMIDAKMNMILKKVKKNIAYIEFEGAVLTPEEGIVMEAQGMTVKTTMNGMQTGTMQIDLNTGFPIAQEVNQNIVGKTEVMGMEIPMIIISKSIVTSK